MCLSWQQGSLQSVCVLDLWTADGHWLQQSTKQYFVLPSGLIVTKHWHYIPSMYKVIIYIHIYNLYTGLILSASSFSPFFGLFLCLALSTSITKCFADLRSPAHHLAWKSGLCHAQEQDQHTSIIQSYHGELLSQLSEKWRGPPAYFPSSLSRFPFLS